MEFKDYYEILGVDADADDKAIKTAYRKLARKYHPDVSEHGDAEAQFKEVSEAYEVLKDSAKRAEYNEIYHYGSHQQEFRPPPGWQASGRAGGDERSHGQGDFSDFFSSIFGGPAGSQTGGFESHQAFNRRGQDIETDLPIFLGHAF